jgi:transcriptional regulator with XRE-family HTH domain
MTRTKAKTDPVQLLLDNIKLQRLKKGFTQEYMAVQLDCNYTTYGKIESGRTALTVEKLYAIAGVLKVSVFELLDPEYSPIDKNKNNKARLVLEIELDEQEMNKLGGWQRFIDADRKLD